MPFEHAPDPAAPPSGPGSPNVAARVRLGARPSLLRAIPHLAAFSPGAETVAIVPGLPPFAFEWVARSGTPSTAVTALRFCEGPWPAPAFGARRAPVILFVAASPGRDPLDAILRASGTAIRAEPAARQRAEDLRAALAEARIGGEAGLDDPGPAALGCAAGEAILVIDPCDPARAPQTRRIWDSAVANAQGRPVRAARSPSALAGAKPSLAATLAGRLAPWTLLDAAAEIHGHDDALALLGLLAGRVVRCDPSSAFAPWAVGGAADGIDLLALLAGTARCADPFRRAPIPIEAAFDLLGAWRRVEQDNRRIAVCVGMSFWKRPRIAAAFASTSGVPAFRRGASAALAEASRRQGGIAVWSSRAPAGLAARAEAAGIPLLWVEDGFIRSAGLGAGFLPGASLIADARAPYYDPTRESELERLFASAEFSPALLERAGRLVATLRARRVTKYNLTGPAPQLPPADGRRRILVPGQVANDLSVLRGRGAAVVDDRTLLAAARMAAPDAFLIYKPHPDVVAGYRRGGVAVAEARKVADMVIADASMADLLDAVDGVHTLTSLTGFEALLRGLPVTVWGRPFYGGWGLTDDRVAIARRRRRLSLTEMVAAALILYPRYIDPVTELPCPPETLLDRLAEPDAWRSGLAMRVRHAQGRVMVALARLGRRGGRA